MIKSIFFDFNGVIIDDENIQLNAYREVLREQHGIDVTEECYFDSLGMDDKTFIKAMFDRANKPMPADALEGVLTAKTARHRTMIEDELPLFPGVVTFLKSASRHFALGLVSMANSNEINYVLERAHLRSLFSVLVMAEDVTVCKPAPDCYRRGLEKLNEQRRSQRLLPVLPGECLAIEDSPPGIQAARGAGMRTLGITNTVGEEELRQVGADVVTHTLADWTVDSVKLLFGTTNTH
jgi:phosphoglycolate phosphatase/beta-phosphoglucomutase